jgi:hypothetical protein
MFRNYDGKKSGFGETSINVTVANPDTVSAFGAQRASDGALTLMRINKQLTANASVLLRLTNCVLTGAGQGWRLTSSNVIQPISSFSFTEFYRARSLP